MAGKRHWMSLLVQGVYRLIRAIKRSVEPGGSAMNLQEYAQVLEKAEEDFERFSTQYGVPFEKAESSPRSVREHFDEACACHCENGGTSLWRNWISPACLACRTGENTGSLFVDLRCTKSCYFCFNTNQPHGEYFRTHKRDIELELEQAYTAGARFRCLAVTGGEPLLSREKVISFFRRATTLYPDVHTRLYTNGELLDEQTLEQLAESGLTEIRFSIKPLDIDKGQERVYAIIEKAVAAIPDVVIEMPVIPGSLDEMRALMRRADAIGVRCINLLEFCFPLHNAEEFCARGFQLRKRPYKYPHDYWYTGGIPVARSEAEALELLRFADGENLRLGVHYCSSDNRNSAQISLQNREFDETSDLRRHYPWIDRDEGDHFLKCAKVFGDEADVVKEWLDARGFAAYDFDADIPSVAFPRSLLTVAREAHPSVVFGESVNVLVEQGGSACSVKELAVRAYA